MVFALNLSDKIKKTMITISETDAGTFDVNFRYNPTIVTEIKQIPGARYNPADKNWNVPQHSKSQLFIWAKTKGLDTTSTDVVIPMDIKALPELTINIPLKRTLFPYQANGVAYGLEKKRFIMGDQPGLGKTGQAIAIAEGSGKDLFLVICPASLKQNWKTEIEEKWTGKKALILTDKTKSTWQQYYNVGMIKYVIVNYESLKKYFVESIDEKFDKNGDRIPLRINHIHFKKTIDLFKGVIVDESHRCKDGKTQQTKFTMGICKGKEYIMALTGTPVVNKPIDLMPQLFMIEQAAHFGGYKGFVGRYCDGFTQASNLKELNYKMHEHCFYRREKKDVLKDLPDKIRNIVKIDITNRAEYNKAENDLRTYLRENMLKTEGEITTALRGETMVMIGILKQISARGKVESVLEHIREVSDAGEKMVLFAWHKEIVKNLHESLPGSVTVTGADNYVDRQRNVDNFQACAKCGAKMEDHAGKDHEHKLSAPWQIICNIKSGGVGITLTAASRVGFIELPWHPADADQCEDRCHRISQKDSVQATYFLGENTIDEYIYSIIEKKRLVVNQVTGSDEDIATSEVSMVDGIIGFLIQ